jgi:glycosyltransferase involved in cell wall biosynthesis
VLITILCILVVLATLEDVWRVWRIPRLGPHSAPVFEQPFISVIIPARNEVARIDACLIGLAAQSYRHFEVIVLDDHSDDGTADLVRSYVGRVPGLCVKTGETLPDGWFGKCWACWQSAAPARGDWLLFLDADVLPSPELLAALVGKVQQQSVDMISLLPLMLMGSTAERLVLPAFFDLVRRIYPFELVNDRTSPLAFAIGQCVFIRKTAYLAIDGHRAVRTAIVEDMELARLIKHAHYRLLAAEAPDLLAVRMYTNWPTVREGLGKNAVAGYRNGGLRSAFAALRLIGFAWLPPNLALAGILLGGEIGGNLLLAGVLVGAVAMAASCWIAQWRFRINPFWGALLPIGVLTYFGIALWALLRLWRGKGLLWKGRVLSQ